MDLKQENLILLDCDYEENRKFQQELELLSGLEFQSICLKTSRMQGKLSKLVRYASYFLLPFSLIRKNKTIKVIIAWQQFYGLLYAFWCRMLKLKKHATLIIMTYIYIDKSGIIGKIYKKFMSYILTGQYIDCLVCFSKHECDMYAKKFSVERNKFVYSNLTIEDRFTDYEKYVMESEYYLSAGRSNRDYDFLCAAFEKMPDRKLIIICDSYQSTKVPSNVIILNSVYGEKYFLYLAKAKAVIVPLQTDVTVSSGQLVMIQSMMFKKICIVTCNEQSKEYIQDGYNGILINNVFEELENTIAEIEKGKFDYIKSTAREHFLRNHTGSQMSKTVSSILEGILK